MRIVAKFSIQDRVKYISHLDTMRAIQRAMTRANIPIEFSEGFHPHPKFSIAFALSVGMTSEGEYMDISLRESMEPYIFKTNMNRALPKGISILEAKEISEDLPSLASMIDRAEYIIEMPYEKDDINSILEEFLNKKSIIVEKQGKRGVRYIDIRNMIFSIEVVERLSKSIKIKSILKCSDKKNLNPKLLIQAMTKFANINYDEALYSIHRVEMYIYRDNCWITPLEL